MSCLYFLLDKNSVITNKKGNYCKIRLQTSQLKWIVLTVLDTTLKEFWNTQLLTGPLLTTKVNFYQEKNIHSFPLLCQDCHHIVEGYTLAKPDFPFVNPCWVFPVSFSWKPQLAHPFQFGVFQYKKYMNYCPAQSHRFKELESSYKLLLYEQNLRGMGLVTWSREGSKEILGGQTLEGIFQIDHGVPTLGGI